MRGREWEVRDGQMHGGEWEMQLVEKMCKRRCDDDATEIPFSKELMMIMMSKR